MEDKSSLVNHIIGAHNRPYYHAILVYIIDRENSHNMFKDNCLIAIKRKDQSPRIFHLEILVYLIL
jgi:hypothetical protein